MSRFKRKTYNNSYLYNLEAAKNNKAIMDYIMSAQRIEKDSEMFANILDEVRRMQRSSVLYNILNREDVVLCVNKVEMPRCFKVMEVKDFKEDKQPKVFIDVTNLITINKGYYVCKKPDILITYLYNALGYMLYSHAPEKITNNSNMTITGADCYASLFAFILDYLRIIGYAENREKIIYMTALFYQKALLGKEIDQYTKNIAAKVAKLSLNDIRGFDLYYNENVDFENIKSFIDFISSTFKLKGLTLEVFVEKWIYLFGTGTQYAVELFTSFMTLITSAYCGSYIVRQKQIERSCGKSMVGFSDNMIKIGTEEFEVSRMLNMEEAEYDRLVPRSKSTMELREAVNERGKKPADIDIKASDCSSISTVKDKASKAVDYYTSSKQLDKLSIYIRRSALTAIKVASKIEGYESGVVEAILKIGKKYLDSSDKRQINNALGDVIGKFEDKRRKPSDDKEASKKYASMVVELRKCLKYV